MSATISFCGKLGGDAELRKAGDSNVLSMNVASNSRQKVNGEYKSTPTWFRVSLFGKQGEAVAKFCTKGTTVFVTGELTVNEFESQGKSKYSLNVRASTFELVGSSNRNTVQPANNNQSQQAKSDGVPWDDDDLSF